VERIHPFVPPLALAVITLIGAAIVIGFDHSSSSTTTTTTPPVQVIKYRGGKLPPRAHKPPVTRPVAVPRWLGRELGPKSPGAPLVRVVSRDLRITITRRGFVIDYRKAHLSRNATGIGKIGPLVRYRRGTIRRVPLGFDATVVRGSVTSSYLLVNQRFGSRTWTWHVSTNLKPRVRKDGALPLSGPDSFLVQPPRVYDRIGRDVTPRGLRWRLAREAGGYRLGVLITDRRLPLPYVISG
jgi:hypothetical protein